MKNNDGVYTFKKGKPERNHKGFLFIGKNKGQAGHRPARRHVSDRVAPPTPTPIRLNKNNPIIEKKQDKGAHQLNGFLSALNEIYCNREAPLISVSAQGNPDRSETAWKSCYFLPRPEKSGPARHLIEFLPCLEKIGPIGSCLEIN